MHQKISGALFLRLGNFLRGETCQIYSAPFDLRFPKNSNEDDEIQDEVQPDSCVICDPDKLDDRGCIGASGLIVEILSPGNSKTELKHKFELYESNGVWEYWIIHAETQDLLIYILTRGKFIPGNVLFGKFKSIKKTDYL
ncbi:Uma2 family endonuclease [Cyclobacterium roseum]|uniref:Uma2 family endonuclease n=1 Tax=Cyclobacterium roseum TaxID=2666137 RepID=UPI0021D2C80C|nr:Uma2 family endonuclease [Cyclobacterium roseum]